VLAGLVSAIQGLWLRPVAAGQKPAAATGESMRADTGERGNRAMSVLAIELRLAKEAYDTCESANATIVFRNQGKGLVKFPMVEGDLGILFFDFAIIGSMGTQFLTNHGQAWSDPSVKGVKLIQLSPGKTHTVRLRNVLPFEAFDAGQFRGEQFKVVAVYRDHCYGHSPTYPEFGKKDPAVWKGILFSNPVTIKRITRREDAQRKAQELRELVRGFLRDLKDMGVSPDDPRVEALMKKTWEGSETKKGQGPRSRTGG